MGRKNYYELFGIYPPVQEDQLEQAYHRLIFEYHPDRNRERHEWAVEKTMEIVEAYKVLSDPKRRALYDFEVRNTIRREAGVVGKGGILGNLTKGKEVNRAKELFAQGLAAYDEGREKWNEAVHAWQQAARVIPEFPNAYYNLGILSAYQERFADALAYFEKTLQVAPEDSDAKRVKNTVMGFLYGRKVS